MGKIRVHEFVSADGVFEDPSFTVAYGFPESIGAAIGEITVSAKVILLGRNTFEMFAPAWSTRTADDDPGAPFFNDTTKVVVSSTMSDADSWQNSGVIGAYDAETIRALKEGTVGDLYISGSGQLVRALLRDGLVDELHLFVYPVILGAGERLFHGMEQTSLQLLSSQPHENGVVHLVCGPAH